MPTAATRATVAELRERVWNGESVTFKDYAAALDHESATGLAEQQGHEYDALIAQGADIAARKQLVLELQAEATALIAENLEHLRDLYASYVGSRSRLAGALDDYCERRRVLARRIPDDLKLEVSLPQELHRQAMLHLADIECQTGVGAAHLLRTPERDHT